ncbi:MAG: SOS response-associated peptidase, partial [Thermodesulfobacteriota bacterium]
MCGRFARYDDEKDLVERFNFSNPSGILFEKRFNIAPTQTVPVILLENDNRVIKLMRWGLVPFWAKDPTIGNRLINARAETITEKASFKTPLKKNRCLVPASGFYEWKKDERIKTKIPIYFRLKNEEPFAFAGIWDDWKKPEGDRLITFTIITTMANELMKPIHDRMPVI